MTVTTSPKPNGGQHPWRIDEGYQSTLRLSNPDPIEANSVLVSVYSGSTPWVKKVKVDALSSVSLDIGKIVRMQHEDDRGRRLPPNAFQGLVRWFTLSEPVIFGELIQTDMLSNLIRPFACYQTEIPCGVSLDNDTVGVGASVTEYADVLGCTALKGQCSASSCVGGAGACSDDFGGLSTYNWSVGNSSIVRLSSPPTAAYADLYGVAQGSTYYRVIGTVSRCTERGLGTITAACPAPVNFRQTAAYDAGSGTLHFAYAWDSSTGDLADLTDCTVQEEVDYPPADDPFPAPFPPMLVQNPTVLPSPPALGTGGVLYDDHVIICSFRKPYFTNSFTATQYYKFTCSCQNNGQPYVIDGPLSIVRSVSQNSNGTWKYTVTKSGASATINPLP